MTFSKATNINSYILDLWYEYFGVSKNLPERSSRSTGISPKNEWMELHDIKRARHNKIKLSSRALREPTRWERILTSNRQELVSRTDTELQELNAKEVKLPVGK